MPWTCINYLKIHMGLKLLILMLEGMFWYQSLKI